MSSWFHVMMWEVTGVPDRSGIRIHAGNYAGPHLTDSHGCILPCEQWADINHDGVMDGTGSKLALAFLEQKLSPFQTSGIELDVRDWK